MILKEAAGAVVPALPLSEFAEHLRLGFGFADDGSQDPHLDRALKAAASAIERRLGLAIITRRFIVEASAWDRRGALVLPIGPVSALVSARFVGAGASTDLDIADLEVEAEALRARLVSQGGGRLPEIPAGQRAEVTFDAGLAADWGGVPGDLRQAVLVLASEFFEAPPASGAAGLRLPGPVEALLAPYRPMRL